MTVSPGTIAGVFVVTSPKFGDRRGFFREHYRYSELAAALGREPRMRQGNHSRSCAGVLRGFHTEPWDKLLYVARGTALCVVADTRPASPTFARHQSFLMGDPPGEHIRVFVSEGLSNAFYCFTEVDYLNDVSEEFRPERRGGVLWSDETLAVEWPSLVRCRRPSADAAHALSFAPCVRAEMRRATRSGSLCDAGSQQGDACAI